MIFDFLLFVFLNQNSRFYSVKQCVTLCCKDRRLAIQTRRQRLRPWPANCSTARRSKHTSFHPTRRCGKRSQGAGMSRLERGDGSSRCEKRATAKWWRKWWRWGGCWTRVTSECKAKKTQRLWKFERNLWKIYKTKCQIVRTLPSTKSSPSTESESIKRSWSSDGVNQLNRYNLRCCPAARSLQQFGVTLAGDFAQNEREADKVE